MKTLYLDCGMGAAGDMLLGALVDLTENPDGVLEELNHIGIPHVKYRREIGTKCGISGTHMRVFAHGHEEGEPHEHHDHADHHEHHHDHVHHHASLADIRAILDGLHLSGRVREQVWDVYQLIAEAESHAHNCAVSEIHFHEVGTLDAVADITGVCYLFDALGVARVVSSPVHVGSGQVHCAHGILPVPAPATAFLLRDIPMYGGAIAGELCTPTGAALLRYFASEFGAMPLMRVHQIGYGMGTKDFPAANCVRALLGETDEHSEDILELTCNLDDMTAEEIGFAVQVLLDHGALDAFWTTIGMKKNRPGVMLTCLCCLADHDAMVRLLFAHTSTLGIRQCVRQRCCLSRTERTVQTPHGTVRLKQSSGYGVTRCKPEFDDVSRIAQQQNCSIRSVLEELSDVK